MPCKIPEPVETYLRLVESGEPKVCREQTALAAMIRKTFDEEELAFEAERFAGYAGIARYFSFGKLFPWEAFLTALWLCIYKTDGTPRWKTLFCDVGRGSGKDAFIAFTSAAVLSPYNPVGHYNVDICAMNEEQAVTPVKDVCEMLEGPAEKKLLRFYYHTKEIVQGRKNKGVMIGRTNNPKGRDGMRSGMVIFNEVHAYENYDNITVFVTGQGKVADPRVGIFTSNGKVSDGPLDDYDARAKRILFEGEPDGGFLPFVCRLDAADEVNDESCWYKANPSLAYLPHLLQETRDEYQEWIAHPEQNEDFLAKRMGIRKVSKEIAVTDYDKVLATNVLIPDVSGRACTVGVDYAELSDWAAVDLHFREGEKRIDICHAWICRDSKTLPRVKAPWRKWCEDGLCTYVDDVSIAPEILAEYIAAAGRQYNVKMLVMDNFRWTLMADALKKIGFDAADKTRVKLIRPSDIMKIDPVVQDCFDRRLFVWGDNPALRWAVNNTKRVRASRAQGADTGNFYYAKIEAKSRKTDMFMALVAAMCGEDKLGTGTVTLPPIGAIGL